MDRRQLGAVGESLAAAHYRKDGYEILAANYRTRMGEIDLVAQRGEMLVFAEVKTRGAGAIATPREAVDCHKQRRLVLAAQAYLAEKAMGELRMRFDVVEVIFDTAGGHKLNRIENAFEL